MISTFPPMFPSSDSILGNPFPSFDGGFTPWDYLDLLPAVQTPEPVEFTSNSAGSGDTMAQSSKPIMSVSGSGSDDPNSNRSNSKRECPDQPSSVVDERKRRRMISNRESARRSRMRKQRHLENLRNEVNRLRVENRELTNQLRLFSCHFQCVRTENGQLQSEHAALRQKLYDINQILLFRQLQQFSLPTYIEPCNNVISEQTPSLIT
ncbi:bZIP transcription factor 11-like [Humulus lupulus]|uniref:bZIP transcription factor 11-like n=1 Tax=Humulus lupulus TaxID=3486 RepID=UPI002B40D7FF|nr:bZIP transcription factor 11-like [Humulus lupulus]